MSLTSDFFKVERDGGVAHLIMARPEKANAMSPEFWTDLPRLMHGLAERPEMRAVVISAEGKHFTAGIDLAAFSTLPGMGGGEPGRNAYAFRAEILRLQEALSSLEEVRLPTICAIHGACMGGGIDMITAADIRLATRDAFFGIEEINIGLAADLGTLQRLPKLIAPGIVRELTFTGRRFSAEEALGWGLVNSLHESHEAVVAAALEMAATIASKSPLATAGAKYALNYARDHSVRDGLDQIATWNGGALRPEDLTKAMAARQTKSDADFADMPTKIA